MILRYFYRVTVFSNHSSIKGCQANLCMIQQKMCDQLIDLFLKHSPAMRIANNSTEQLISQLLVSYSAVYTWDSSLFRLKYIQKTIILGSQKQHVLAYVFSFH